MSFLGNLPVFDCKSSEWDTFRSQLTEFSTSSSVSEKKALLIKHLSDETNSLLRELAQPAEVEELRYEMLLTLLDAHFEPRESSFGNKVRFFEAVRGEGEAVGDWAVRLSGLARGCGFGAARRAGLRDRFVLGLRPGPARDALFDRHPADLTLERALELAEQVETASLAKEAAVKEEPVYVEMNAFNEIIRGCSGETGDSNKKIEERDSDWQYSDWLVSDEQVSDLVQHLWYVGEMSRQRAETLLAHEAVDGGFVVRKTSLYKLSLFTRYKNRPNMIHYLIKQDECGKFYICPDYRYPSIPELISYHKLDGGGMYSRLKSSPYERPAPLTDGFAPGNWEIDPSEIELHEELKSGFFGVWRRGRWRAADVAVKLMTVAMSAHDYLEEAKILSKLQHENIVQLLGVCTKQRPLYIVVESMDQGTLFRHLKGKSISTSVRLDTCIQVCSGMVYLESQKYIIHRNLTTRSCRVTQNNIVKVDNFEIARYVPNDQYIASRGSKVAIGWASPEIFEYLRFSTKSDVWAFGILLWEVFTSCKLPYPVLNVEKIAEMVCKGEVPEQPIECPSDIYDVMLLCWLREPEDRPSFRTLKDMLTALATTVGAN